MPKATGPIFLSRAAVAAEPAPMVGGRPLGVLRQRCRGPVGSVSDPRGVRAGEARATAVRSAPDDEIVGYGYCTGVFSSRRIQKRLQEASRSRCWRRATSRSSGPSRTFARSTSKRCRSCSSRSWRWRWSAASNWAGIAGRDEVEGQRQQAQGDELRPDEEKQQQLKEK